MRRILFGLRMAAPLVALAVLAMVFSYGKATAGSIVKGNWRDFGVENQDTVIVLNSNELAINANTPLFFGDFRDNFSVEADVRLGTRVTEQAFICKEGGKEEVAGDLTIGFDPEEERIFAEVKDEAGFLHRIKAGDKVETGKWYHVKVAAGRDAEGKNSTMTLSVAPEGKGSVSRTVRYAGNALPDRVGRWIVGRGYPGGFPNSLQVRNGEIRNLSISGEGLERMPGQNPIFTDRFTADPACTVVGDRLYAYVGEDMAAPGGWFSMPHWVAYSTADMKTWECHGPVLEAKAFPNANPNGAWAAQVVEKDGKFYFYVTLDDTRDGRHMIDVAVGDNPLGPFVPARKDGTPLITDDMTTDSHRWNADIDPTVLIDDDGTSWIAWGNGDCYMARLKPNMIELDGEIRHVGLRNYSEGPWLFKRNGIYYNVYAADAPGVQPEQIAYSTSKSIEGPWQYGGILTGPAKYGFTIHPSVNEFKGKWYFFYHDGSYMIDGQPGGDCRRRVCVEELKFNPDGSIAPVSLTEEGLGSCISSDEADIPAPFGPVPTENQLKWQDMEMYAFIHYSLNTYTDQEWGFGNEDPRLFNPSDLDVRQWVKVCKDAGMKGIIFTAKHHCGFCMWPSAFTEYSVKNSPWKDGKGDVVKELADACREAGLKYALYLSPWDRNHPEYGRPEYVEYFRNQLRELLTNYGDVLEVWFDGANGGDGWYGGANETRRIDRTTYYQWPETYGMIRELQPGCLIWNDGSDRGDLRWVGTEGGEVGATNWSQLDKDGEVDWGMLHFGLEGGDSWVPGETNTSIRPGWFYHTTEDENVKSLSKLMDTYYKSVGRNSTLLLNFPVMPNGRIHPTDSLRGAAFARMIDEVFKEDIAKNASVSASSKRGNGMKYAADKVIDGEKDTYWATDDSVTSGHITLSFKEPVTFNRFLAEEFIPLGQRVREWKLEAHVNGQWIELKDALTDDGRLTTIGHRRIVCFPAVAADSVRFTVTDSKACPVISRLSMYNAPELTADIPDSGEKRSSSLRIFYMHPKAMAVDLGKARKVKGIRYLPPSLRSDGTVTHYTVYTTTDWSNWKKVASGEFSNIVNNPIWQTVSFDATDASVIRFEADRMSGGEHMAYSDFEVIYE